MLTKMIFATLLLFALSALNGYASEKKREANCTVVIAADLHFDLPPETDQFHHVLAINALGDQRRIDGVILAGDLFDKSHPKILDLYRQRWERGPGYRQIHYDTYPTFGNHDIHQVNNAWRDDDGNASFDVLQIKGKRVTVETYEVLDDNGNFKRL